MKRSRDAKVLVLVVVSLSAILGTVGLVVDGGLMTIGDQNLQHATDAAATAAAMDLLLGKDVATAKATATTYLQGLNGLSAAAITVNIPPLQGSYAGRSGYVEVTATEPYATRLMQIVGAGTQQTLSARSVAGYRNSTAGGAVVILDPSPSPLSIAQIPLTLPSYPTLIGGLEVLGIGTVRVDGAVLVNNTWGGVDEEGNPAGSAAGPPYGISCMPLLSLTHLQAQDIRVAGGVDNQANYGNSVAGKSSPLKANRLPVPDPYKNLPVPSALSDPSNVNMTVRGGKQVLTLPIITTTLQPGVYDWIEVLAGNVVFQPGIYVIRGVNPTSGIALNIAGGVVTANGVLFYITNSTAYNAATGSPDLSDGETRPVAGSFSLGGVTPSVVLNAALLGSSFSPLSDPHSPFNGMLVYQRRQDARPIVVVHQGLLLGGSVAGTFYAKWGHVLFTGLGAYNIRIVSGTARLDAVLAMTITPSALLPPAQDVFLVE